MRKTREIFNCSRSLANNPLVYRHVSSNPTSKNLAPTFPMMHSCALCAHTHMQLQPTHTCHRWHACYGSLVSSHVTLLTQHCDIMSGVHCSVLTHKHILFHHFARCRIQHYYAMTLKAVTHIMTMNAQHKPHSGQLVLWW